MNKLNNEEIQKLEKEEKIQEYLFDKVYELGKEIIKIREIKHEESPDNNRDSEIYRMQQDIYYNSIWFESYRSLSDRIRYWNEDETLDEKIEFIVKIYNELIDEIEEYQKQKERIEKEGFEKLDKDLQEGLREIFCKMLDYKNRDYKKDSSLLELIEELVLCYSDYKWMLDDTYTMLKSRVIYRNTERDNYWTIHADNVEYISNLEFTYKYFSEDEDSYKNYQQFHEDITLKEGQTLENLYFEEKEKLRLLLIEMLEFIKVEIPKDKNYNSLEYRVNKYYPFYNSNFTLINGTCNYSYIESIQVLKDNYNYFKNTYKDHKNMFINYVKKEEEQYNKSKEDIDILYDPEWYKDLQKLKEEFKDYFEEEDK